MHEVYDRILAVPFSFVIHTIPRHQHFANWILEMTPYVRPVGVTPSALNLLQLVAEAVVFNEESAGMEVKWNGFTIGHTKYIEANNGIKISTYYPQSDERRVILRSDSDNSEDYLPSKRQRHDSTEFEEDESDSYSEEEPDDWTPILKISQCCKSRVD